MPKKIYDIKPPKLAHKKVLVEAKSKKETQTTARRKKERRSILPRVLIGVLVVIIFVAVFLFFKLPKAEIIIWPKLDTLSFSQTITADKSADSIDSVKLVIPAQLFQASKTNSQDFPATGSAANEGQAVGMITVYNKCNPWAPLTLPRGAHFLSDKGKNFAYLQKIVIPAATKKGPGSVEVKVTAVESGDSYNIAPAYFSLPGLNGTTYFSCIYGVSTSAMSGGYVGKVKKVTADDIQGAKDVLTKKTISDAMADLKSQISSDYILLNNAVLSNLTSASTQTKPNTIADNFNYQTAVSAGALAFKKSDLEGFAKNYIISQIPDGKTLLENSFKIDYSASSVDVSGGKATLNLNFSSVVYQNVDKNSLSLSLLGENTNQINQTINGVLGDNVSKIKINFWPFWVSSVPNNQNAVTINLKFQ